MPVSVYVVLVIVVSSISQYPGPQMAAQDVRSLDKEEVGVNESKLS